MSYKGMIQEIFGIFGNSEVDLTALPEPSENGAVRIIPHYTVEKNTDCPEGYPDSLMNVKITAQPEFKILIYTKCPECKKCEPLNDAIPKIKEIMKQYGVSTPNQHFDGKKLILD